MKRIYLSIFLFTIAASLAFGQPDRIGVGLSFANVLDFNSGETSNPGFFLKTWITLDKRKRAHIVPSVTAYNRYKLDPGTYVLKNYMFQGDIDMQYVFFQEKTVKIIGYGGVNYTYLYSTFEPYGGTHSPDLSNAKDWAVGGNVGAGLELRMTDHWDFIVSGKYKISKLSQFIISVNAAYYFRNRGRAYRR